MSNEPRQEDVNVNQGTDRQGSLARRLQHFVNSSHRKRLTTVAVIASPSPDLPSGLTLSSIIMESI